MDDGSLRVVFGAMPPEDASPEEDALFAHFGERMQEAIGVEVLWEDRETFLVPRPQEQTVQQLKQFLANCRREARAVGGQRHDKSPRRLLTDTIAAILSPVGFRPTHEGFRRAITGGDQRVLLAWYRSGVNARFSLVVTLRLNEAECLVDPAARPEASTVATQLEHFGLRGEPPLGVTFAGGTAAEVRESLQALEPLLQERILPFLEQHGDVASLDASLHPTSRLAKEGLLSGVLTRLRLRDGQGGQRAADAWEQWRQQRGAIDSTGEPYRTMHALAVAHLARNGRLRELTQRYVAALAAMDLQPEMRQRVNAFLERLSSHSSAR